MYHKKAKNILDNFFNFFDKYPREYFIFAFFAIFIFFILKETFSYTVLHYDFYNDLAYKQQVGKVEIPVTRGTIYSATGSGTVFATSVDLNDLAVDPKIEWDKEKLWEYLTDIVYRELCFLKNNKKCYENVLKYLKKLQIEDFERNEKYIKEILGKRITKKLSQTKITSVLLAEKIGNEESALLFSKNMRGVYINNTNVYVNPEEVVNPERVSNEIGTIIWMNKKDIEHRIRKRELRYIPIINKLSLWLSDEIKTKISEEKQAIKQGVLDKKESLGGFIIMTPHPQRIYPEWQIAAQIMWFLDNEGIWHYGLEWYFNELLRWTKWEIVSRKDIRGRIINPMSLDKNTMIGEWADVYTTIDRNVQRKIERILENGVKRYGANKGTIVVMNPHNGAIISMANYPTFDPNSPWNVYELEKISYVKYPNPETDLLWKTIFVEDTERGKKYIYDGKEIYLREAKRSEYTDYKLVKYKYKNDFWAGVYKNDAISSLYEPWSIMKGITIAIWLDTWEITQSSMYNDLGKLKIDNFTIKNVSSKCLWYHSFAHALAYSCNVWMIRISQRVGQSLFHQYLNDFWFWDITDISLQWETFAHIEPYEKWSKARLFTSSYWLWVGVTPLQMATAYSVIANGGLYIKPRIIEKIKLSDGKEIQYKKEIVRRVLKETTAKTTSKMLVNWVEHWVAKNGAVEGYTIAWKTGTSQIAYRGKYEKWIASTYGSFAWFAPAEDPQFVIIVKLERPRTNNYWGQTSAFVFAEVAKELFDYYGIPKKNQR